MQQQNSSSSSRSSSNVFRGERNERENSRERGGRNAVGKEEWMRCRMDKSFFVGRTIKCYHAIARTVKWESPMLMPTELDRRIVLHSQL